tara:strand:+ start:380 stop:526 length:147 start_codon:yes stop_codon:yes gene_type:complete
MERFAIPGTIVLDSPVVLAQLNEKACSGMCWLSDANFAAMGVKDALND